jgi:hypothetical protein
LFVFAQKVIFNRFTDVLQCFAPPHVFHLPPAGVSYAQEKQVENVAAF